MTYSPYDRWLNDLTTDEFHEHVAGRMEYDGRKPYGSGLGITFLAILAAWACLLIVAAYYIITSL